MRGSKHWGLSVLKAQTPLVQFTVDSFEFVPYVERESSQMTLGHRTAAAQYADFESIYIKLHVYLKHSLRKSRMGSRMRFIDRRHVDDLH